MLLLSGKQLHSHVARRLGTRGALSSAASRQFRSVHCTCARSAMAPELLLSTPDAFGGLVIDASSLPKDPQSFKAVLLDSLQAWKNEGKKGVWLKVPLMMASHIAPAVELQFRPHHAEPDYIMLCTWLSSSPCTIPPNASHQVGIGACVVNEHHEILMVMEKNGPLKGKGVWKIPTGLVDAGEDLNTAAEREVMEETGIKTTFDSVLAIRQAHGFGAGKSDLFILVGLKPEAGQPEVTPCEAELEAARWMPMKEYEELSFLRGVELYDKLRERCIAYAQGRYKGWKAEKLEGRSLDKSRKDLLLCGDLD